LSCECDVCELGVLIAGQSLELCESNLTRRTDALRQ